MRNSLINLIVILVSLSSGKVFADHYLKESDCKILPARIRGGDPSKVQETVKAICLGENDHCYKMYHDCAPMAYLNASLSPHPRTAEILDRYKFDVGEEDENGKTALDTAVDNCNAAQVLTLRLFGADNTKIKPNLQTLSEVALKHKKEYEDNAAKLFSTHNVESLRLKKFSEACERTKWVLSLTSVDLIGFVRSVINDAQITKLHNLLIERGFDDECQEKYTETLSRDIRRLEGEHKPNDAIKLQLNHCKNSKASVSEDDLERLSYLKKSEVDTLIITMYGIDKTQSGILRQESTASASVKAAP